MIVAVSGLVSGLFWGLYLGCIWTVLGLCWCYNEAVLGMYWGCIGIVLGVY